MKIEIGVLALSLIAYCYAENAAEAKEEIKQNEVPESPQRPGYDFMDLAKVGNLYQIQGFWALAKSATNTHVHVWLQRASERISFDRRNKTEEMVKLVLNCAEVKKEEKKINFIPMLNDQVLLRGCIYEHMYKPGKLTKDITEYEEQAHKTANCVPKTRDPLWRMMAAVDRVNTMAQEAPNDLVLTDNLAKLSLDMVPFADALVDCIMHELYHDDSFRMIDFTSHTVSTTSTSTTTTSATTTPTTTTVTTTETLEVVTDGAAKWMLAFNMVVVIPAMSFL